jgi:hypothetical protein
VRSAQRHAAARAPVPTAVVPVSHSVVALLRRGERSESLISFTSLYFTSERGDVGVGVRGAQSLEEAHSTSPHRLTPAAAAAVAAAAAAVVGGSGHVRGPRHAPQRRGSEAPQPRARRLEFPPSSPPSSSSPNVSTRGAARDRFRFPSPPAAAQQWQLSSAQQWQLSSARHGSPPPSPRSPLTHVRSDPLVAAALAPASPRGPPLYDEELVQVTGTGPPYVSTASCFGVMRPRSCFHECG